MNNPSFSQYLEETQDEKLELSKDSSSQHLHSYIQTLGFKNQETKENLTILIKFIVEQVKSISMLGETMTSKIKKSILKNFI